MATWYVGQSKYLAVPVWTASTSIAVGALRRPTGTISNQRVFRAVGAGISAASEPTWPTTQGASVSDGGVTWTEVTGQSAFGWGAAHFNLSNALATGWAAAGDTIYISKNHAETFSSGALTYNFPGIAASPNQLICVDDAVAPPTALATGASLATTGGNAITLNGYGYIYGVTFNVGTGASAASFATGNTSAGLWFKLEACSIRLLNTSTTSRINFGVNAAARDFLVELVNTSLSFANVSQGFMARGGRFRWLNTSAPIIGTVPTILIPIAAGVPGFYEFIGIDFSALGAGKSIADIGQLNAGSLYFQDCKLGAGSISTGSTIGQGGVDLSLVNCDSANTNYRYLKSKYQGTITHETAVTRIGGAFDGAINMARKMVSGSGSKFFSPLESDPILVWNDSLAPVTISASVITDNISLTDADAWIEVEYLGTSGFPQGNYISDRCPTSLGSSTGQPGDSSNWNTPGISTPVAQKLEVTFTPTAKGLIRARVMLARPSTTMYFCPLLNIS